MELRRADGRLSAVRAVPCTIERHRAIAPIRSRRCKCLIRIYIRRDLYVASSILPASYRGMMNRHSQPTIHLAARDAN